jgi:hypothetical protein
MGSGKEKRGKRGSLQKSQPGCDVAGDSMCLDDPPAASREIMLWRYDLVLEDLRGDGVENGLFFTMSTCDCGWNVWHFPVITRRAAASATVG